MFKLEESVASLAAAEAQVPNLRADCAKEIVWAGEPETQTPLALVYIHGFSATKHELRPLPDLVAKALGVNMFFTRLTGHGQDGAAMGRATLKAWQADVDEALAYGAALGKRTIVMGCSTGCTLATLALANGANALAMVHVSPNFSLRSRVAQTLLDLPGARHWSDLVVGRTRSFTPISPAHQAYWTVRYPTAALHPMADAVRAVRQSNLSGIKAPALFCVNPNDQVISPAQAKLVQGRWGAETQWHDLQQGPHDDKMGHVMAGDVFSPNQTKPLADHINRWLDHVI